MNFALWLPVFAAFFGALTHALSADGGGSVLAKFGVTWAIPKWALGPAVILAGCAAGVFENVQQGLSWQDAAAKGVLAAFAAVFGVLTSQYTTGREPGPPAGPVAMLCLVGALAMGTSGCAAFQKTIPYLPTPSQIACAELEADKGTPVLAIITSCGFAQDAFQIVEALVLGHKKAGAMRAAAAADAGVHDAGADAK